MRVVEISRHFRRNGLAPQILLAVRATVDGKETVFTADQWFDLVNAHRQHLHNEPGQPVIIDTLKVTQ